MLKNLLVVTSMSEFNLHKPVLLNEVLSFVKSDDNQVVVDMTLGRAGHAKEICKKIGKGSKYYGIDRDNDAINYCKDNFKSDKVKITLIHSNFSSAIKEVKKFNETSASFILLDIGVSSPQFDDPTRGFSYRYDSPLDMRMNQDDKLSAYDVINHYSEEDLVYIFSNYGQCHNAKRVSKNIILRRKEKPIKTTFELVDVIKEVLPSSELKAVGHPAKQYFLALRYEVNQELKELETGLKEAIEFLSKNGRLASISFNFLEDKIVKNVMSSYVSKIKKDKYKQNDEEDSYSLLTKKPITATEEELETNNRAKSAIMRIIERR